MLRCIKRFESRETRFSTFKPQPRLGDRMTSFLATVTLGDLWALLFVQGAVNLLALGLVHGHQR